MERSEERTMKRARGRALHACIVPIKSAKSPGAAKGACESTGPQIEPKQRRAGREPATDCPCTHRPRLKLVFQCRLWRERAHGARSGRGNASRHAHADHRLGEGTATARVTPCAGHKAPWIWENGPIVGQIRDLWVFWRYKKVF